MKISVLSRFASGVQGPSHGRAFRTFTRMALSSYFRNWMALLMGLGVPLIFFFIYLVPYKLGMGGVPTQVVLLQAGVPPAVQARLEGLQLQDLRFEPAPQGTVLELLARSDVRLVVGTDPRDGSVVVHCNPAERSFARLLARATRPADGTAPDDTSVVVEAPSSADGKLNISLIAAGILVMALLNMGLFGAGVKLLQDRSAGALRLYRNFPVPLFIYIAAELCARLVLIVFQLAVMLALSALFYNVEVGGVALLRTLVVGTLCGIPLVLMGYALAATLPNLSKGVHVFTVANLVSCFLGDLFMPASSVPALRPIVFTMPAAHVSNLVRLAMTDAKPTFEPWQSVAYLAAFSAFALWVTVKKFKYTAGE